MARLKLAVALTAVVALGVAGWMWLRDSSPVPVRDVEITGITASDGDAVRAALEETAQDMTTLHVQPRALRDAVANYPSVGDVVAKADFPHRLTIRVIERRPVAALAHPGDGRLPVTESGV